MWNLIKNEFIKLRYKRKYIICTIVFALICIGFCAVYVKMQKASTPDAAIQYYKDAKSSLQSKEKNIKDATLKQQYDQQISQLDEQIKQYQQSKNQGNSNWKKQLKTL